MINEKSAGAIIWRKYNNELEFLLIQSQPYKQFKSAWSFPKGHLEKNEDEKIAAMREVFEEVGLKPKFDFTFPQSYSYNVTQDISKMVTLFLAKYNPAESIKLQQSEIRNAQWLNLKDSVARISVQDFDEFSCDALIQILKNANDYLMKKDILQ